MNVVLYCSSLGIASCVSGSLVFCNFVVVLVGHFIFLPLWILECEVVWLILSFWVFLNLVVLEFGYG